MARRIESGDLVWFCLPGDTTPTPSIAVRRDECEIELIADPFGPPFAYLEGTGRK